MHAYSPSGIGFTFAFVVVALLPFSVFCNFVGCSSVAVAAATGAERFEGERAGEEDMTMCVCVNQNATEREVIVISNVCANIHSVTEQTNKHANRAKE